MTPRLALFLSLAGCALFGAILFAEIRAPSPDAAAAVALPPSRATAAAPRPSAAPQLDKLVATTLARPLFSATRRPPAAEDKNSGDDDLGNMRLTGIVVAPDHRFAIFAVTGAKPLAVSEGSDVSGWRVDGITQREVSLSGPGGVKTLQPKPDSALVRSSARPPTGPPAPTAANRRVRPPRPPHRRIRPEIARLPGRPPRAMRPRR